MEALMAGERISAELERQAVHLNFRYARCLDENRLSEWPDLFAEDGRYVIHPRDNLEQGLEGYWLYLDNKRMMRDRVVSLLEVNIYQINYERRLVTNIAVLGRDGGTWLARANYLLMHTNNEGMSQVFSVGEYRDRMVEANGRLLFQERVVVPDMFTVPSHLSIPL